MKQKTPLTLLAVLTALVLLGGIAFTVVKAQTPTPETEQALPQPATQSRFELRNQWREERQALRQANEDCLCENLSEAECEALRFEHRLERLDAALAEGLITQEQYDAARAKLEAGEWPPFEPGQGLGLGRGARNGQGQRQGFGQGFRQGFQQGFRQGQGGKMGPRGNGNQGNCPNQP